MNGAATIRRLALAGVLLCLVVVVLGAYVRLTAAGLGCPDWPGCYGHVTPTGAAESVASLALYPHAPLDLGKAWREMVHRYAASALGLIILVIAALAVARRGRAVSVRNALALLVLVVFQGMLGMLTVTWQLKPLVVTLHLLGGLTTLAMLWWLWLTVRHGVTPDVAAPERAPRHPAYPFVVAGLLVIALQIALGGWTSSNYAAVACPDFPTCQGRWWPQADFDDAFVLWRGLGINYEGGVLEHPARVAIHLTHRVGAIVASAALALAVVIVLRRRPSRPARVAAFGVLGALGLQLIVGTSMVTEGFPLALATAHNGGAAVLVLAVVTLLWHTRRAA